MNDLLLNINGTAHFTLQFDATYSKTSIGNGPFLEGSPEILLFGYPARKIFEANLTNAAVHGTVSGLLQTDSAYGDFHPFSVWELETPPYVTGSFTSQGAYSFTLTIAPQPVATVISQGLRFAIIPEVTAPKVTDSLNSTAQLLGGTASAQRNVSVEFLPPVAGSILASDVADVRGTATDVFVLQLTYNEAAAISLFGSEDKAVLGWLDPSDGVWKNAVLGNDGGTPAFAGDRAYDPLTDFLLGTYGVDTATNHVWAVLDHNSQFAATPEPTSAALLGLGTLLLTARRRRSAQAR